MAYKYLTPSVAQIAVEQIEAWYKEEKKSATVPAVISTEGMNVPYFERIMKDANISLNLLVKENIAKQKTEKVGPCGLTDYFRDENTYEIDMAALKTIAAGLKPLPAKKINPTPGPFC